MNCALVLGLLACLGAAALAKPSKRDGGDGEDDVIVDFLATGYLNSNPMSVGEMQAWQRVVLRIVETIRQNINSINPDDTQQALSVGKRELNKTETLPNYVEVVMNRLYLFGTPSVTYCRMNLDPAKYEENRACIEGRYPAFLQFYGLVIAKFMNMPNCLVAASGPDAGMEVINCLDDKLGTLVGFLTGFDQALGGSASDAQSLEQVEEYAAQFLAIIYSLRQDSYTLNEMNP